MTNTVNLREIILNILLEINREEQYSHLAIRSTLEKYQYLPKQDRAFITRICEGTVEYMLQIDYIIDRFSKVRVSKMKPVIQNILRSAVYQICYMDSIPDSAVCNEAVKLAQRKGFYSLKGFVNGVLRNIARSKGHIPFPDREQPVEYLSVKYSMPVWLVEKWLGQLGFEKTEAMLAQFLKERPTSVYLRGSAEDRERTLESLKRQGVTAEPAPYVEGAYYISGYNYLPAVEAFQEGCFQVQDVSSMLAGEAAGFQKGDFVLDLCAAPGGKSLYAADKLQGTGMVEARDLTSYKIGLLEENMERCRVKNMRAVRSDATVLDKSCIGKADVVLADVPCSGLGVIGRKTDIKYKMTAQKQSELVKLQRRILSNASQYVKANGTLIFSTCTVDRAENEENLEWFLKNHEFEAESLDEYLCEELHSETTARGYLQLLPGTHGTDGFFLARLRKKEI